MELHFPPLAHTSPGPRGGGESVSCLLVGAIERVSDRAIDRYRLYELYRLPEGNN